MSEDLLNFVAGKPDCFERELPPAPPVHRELTDAESLAEFVAMLDFDSKTDLKSVSTNLNLTFTEVKNAKDKALPETPAKQQLGSANKASLEPIDVIGEPLVNTAALAAASLSAPAEPSTGAAATPAPSCGLAIAAPDESPITEPGVYKFPRNAARLYESMSNAELVTRLEQLVSQAFDTPSPAGYSVVRDEVCALHIEANLRQEHAPRFRPMRPLKKKAETQDEGNVALDRQVIDIHWRAFAKRKPSTKAADYYRIFDNNPFCFQTAEKFAQEIWGAPSKATHLHLSKYMQYENAVIQNEAMRKKWLVIANGDVRGELIKQAGAPQIQARLHDAAHNANTPQIIKSIPGMVDAWIARQIVGDGSEKIARMVAKMTGNTLRNSRAMAKTLKSLDRLLSTVRGSKTS